ncbi:hypothetical protein QCA50_018971 [Cerrena zonata]|uniref:Uncharacterized protein n=1 Tax=Cerrena zonata TaxID=2478898 RepID=A0AAW0FA23_9APHY
MSELGLTPDEVVAVYSQTMSQTYMYTASLVGVITRAIALASDVLILGLTLHSSWYIFKANETVRAQSKLLSTLVENGTIQFGTFVLLNVVAITLDLLSITDNIGNASQDFTFFIFIQEGLNSIILSRFILNLHSIYHIDNTSFDASHTSTSINFVPATLDGSCITSRETNTMEDEEMQFSNNPLATELHGNHVIRNSEFQNDHELFAQAGPSSGIDISNRIFL